MRELSRVFQGVLFSPLDVVSKGQTLVALWKHECDRVFSDKLTNFKDKKWFEDNLYRIMSSKFGEQVVDEFRALKEPIYFVDFLRDEIVDEDTDEVLEDAPKIYERVASVAALRQRVDDYLTRYNAQTGGIKPMNLVMFEDGQDTQGQARERSGVCSLWIATTHTLVLLLFSFCLSQLWST